MEFMLLIVGCTEETLVFILKKLDKKLFQQLSYFILKISENNGTVSVKKKTYTTEEAVECPQDNYSYDDSSSEFTESDGIRKESRYKCKDYNVGLCAAPCFGYYHIKRDFSKVFE